MPKLTGKPTHAWIVQFEKVVRQNAMGIPFPSATHGCLRLAVDQATYQTLTGGGNFTIPTWPNNDPIPNNATAAAVAKLQAQKQEATEKKNYWDTADNILKKSITDTIPEDYLLELQGELGYHGKTTRDFIVHLKENFGKVTPEQIKEIEQDMMKQWDPNSPIEQLWHQLETGFQALKGTKGQITNDGIIVKASNIINATGIKDLKKAIQKFEALPSAQQTLATFKKDLTTVYNELSKEDKVTTKDAGYHANAATETGESPITLDNWCWTHGLWNHNSKDCRNKITGHIDDATIHNMCGGCDRIRRPRGEQAIWQPPRRRGPPRRRNNESANETTEQDN